MCSFILRWLVQMPEIDEEKNYETVRVTSVLKKRLLDEQDDRRRTEGRKTSLSQIIEAALDTGKVGTRINLARSSGKSDIEKLIRSMVGLRGKILHLGSALEQSDLSAARVVAEEVAAHINDVIVRVTKATGSDSLAKTAAGDVLLGEVKYTQSGPSEKASENTGAYETKDLSGGKASRVLDEGTVGGLTLTQQATLTKLCALLGDIIKSDHKIAIEAIGHNLAAFVRLVQIDQGKLKDASAFISEERDIQEQYEKIKAENDRLTEVVKRYKEELRGSGKASSARRKRTG